MNKKLSIAVLSAALLLASCGPTGGGQTTSEITKETFSDPILAQNVAKFLDGFKMEGTIVQSRYEVAADGVTVTDNLLETNTYYTDLAFNSKTENAYHKRSYSIIEGEQVESENYTYFEDENGYAYSEELNYKNEIDKVFVRLSGGNKNGYTFSSNGFYNFFELFLDGDLAKNEEVTAYGRYDIDTNKAAVIANNLLYSLNSGAYSVPLNAYFREDGGNFTQFVLEMTPIIAYDPYSGATSAIHNLATFTFSSVGEETIKHLAPNPETEDSAALEEAFAQFDGASYTLKVNDNYRSTSIYHEGMPTEQYDTTTEYSFTGQEIFVHAVSEGEDSKVNTVTDYYLAPLEGGDGSLYPYAYDKDSGTWTPRSEGFTDENGVIRFAYGYVGHFTYEDFLPVIAGVSGTFFTKNGEGTYEADAEGAALMGECFLIPNPALDYEGYENAASIAMTLNEGTLAGLHAPYSYVDSLNGFVNVGTVNATYDLTPVTLEGILG